MKNIKTLLAVVLLISSQTAFSQSEKENDIRKLMEMTGGAEMGKQIIQQMAAMYKQQSPDVPEEFWDSFIEKVDFNEMVEMVIPVYDKHFTHEDIKGLIKFYETPVGQKAIEKLPLIMQKSMMIGQQWGMKIGQQVVEELQKEGY